MISVFLKRAGMMLASGSIIQTFVVIFLVSLPIDTAVHIRMLRSDGLVEGGGLVLARSIFDSLILAILWSAFRARRKEPNNEGKL